MFHMLSCINLASGVTIEEYQDSLKSFASRMLELDLIHSISPICQRCHHPVMDTDTQRDHTYFFTLTFVDRDQCDKAVEHIYSHHEPSDTIHHAMYSKIADPVFICWTDIE